MEVGAGDKSGYANPVLWQSRQGCGPGSLARKVFNPSQAPQHHSQVPYQFDFKIASLRGLKQTTTWNTSLFPSLVPQSPSAMSNSQTIAIIGAGLSGLTLALSLYRQNIPCIIYESRPASLDIGGAIMLSPNALKVLDMLGVYDRMKPLGYNFEQLYFRSAEDTPIDSFEFGSKVKYDYKALRIYRTELIDVLVGMVQEAGVPIEYGKKFTHVVDESENSITWQFEDGTTACAMLLVGADGIHSRVRKHLYPDLTPRFTNMMGVSATVPTKQLKAEGYPLPVTIMSPKHGAFVIAPQRADGSEVFFGRQCRLQEEHDRQGWDNLLQNKEWCIDFLRKGKEDFPSIVSNAVVDIPLKSINLWPFYVVPKLDSWISQSHGRVIILGDAAHAIPPTAGQGVNQAFEDVYTFASMLAKLRISGANAAPSQLVQALGRWQIGRQSRVDKILDLNEQLNRRRLPEEGKIGNHEPFELDWLYGVDFESQVEEWASG